MRTDYIAALRLLGWGAVLLALILTMVAPQVESWQILSSTR